ncbi:TerB family tellurite resistance protein [Marinicella meishanensis]|uniref:tellurite resistance TerB family protein n=1 Tax=Marinicella meishanensis TaxID=2873263 RepID=UPI001CBBA657|nr:TerB family tellurite resistance protein [Marinicella sp. NBU2979]
MKLFGALKALLKTGESNQSLNEAEQKELNHAIVELMLEMVKADFVELYAEKTALSDYLSKELNLSKEDVTRYIEEAELRTDFSISLETQTNVINNYLGISQKLELMQHMWALAVADNEVHLLEHHLFYKAGQLLGIKKTQLDEICQSQNT